MKNYSNSNNYRPYLCEYEFDGHNWLITVEAESFEQAKNRLRQLSTGKVLGTIEEEIPARVSWIEKIWLWITT
jgi:hypothetical protein